MSATVLEVPLWYMLGACLYAVYAAHAIWTQFANGNATFTVTGPLPIQIVMVLSQVVGTLGMVLAWPLAVTVDVAGFFVGVYVGRRGG